MCPARLLFGGARNRTGSSPFGNVVFEEERGRAGAVPGAG